jgi:hypothetical protein
MQKYLSTFPVRRLLLAKADHRFVFHSVWPLYAKKKIKSLYIYVVVFIQQCPQIMLKIFSYPKKLQFCLLLVLNIIKQHMYSTYVSSYFKSWRILKRKNSSVWINDEEFVKVLGDKKLTVNILSVFIYGKSNCFNKFKYKKEAVAPAWTWSSALIVDATSIAGSVFY